MHFLLEEQGKSLWLLSAIYASPIPSLHNSLWSGLSSLDLDSLPWFLCGDFNCIVHPKERKGSRPFQLNNSITSFRDFMFTCNLSYLGFHGSNFTWSNNRIGNSRVSVGVGLDKALANMSWLDINPIAFVFYLRHLLLGHCPLLICTNSYSGPKPTKSLIFEPYWADYPELRSVLNDSWSNPSLPTISLFNLHERLNSLGPDISNGVSTVLGTSKLNSRTP